MALLHCCICALMHFTICAHFLVVRHFARPLWQPAPPIVAEPVASQPKLRLHFPPLIHQYFPNIIFIISVIFPSLFHFFSQSIFASSKPCASSKRSCTTLPPSINTSINRSNHRYLCDVPFNMYLFRCLNIPSLFLCITPQIRNVVINLWEL